jgi:cytochrome c peroxidase
MSRLPKRSCVAAAAGLLLAGVMTALPVLSPPEPEAGTAPTLGDPERLRAAYKGWAAAHEAQGGDRSMLVALGWSKALSAARTTARGTARLDLVSGRLVVEVEGSGPDDLELWLVDNQPVPEDTVMPEPHDLRVRVGRLAGTGEKRRLSADLGAAFFRGFDPDLVVLARAGTDPSRGGLLFGSPTLFQRMYHRAERRRAGLPEDPALARIAFPAGAPGLFDSLRTTVNPTVKATGDLVAEGSDLFFKGTFGGNGRTCGTCHPANNNLTIDPAFIATLQPSNALFVAETNPDLAVGFENPQLMRKVGLILENVDGFDNPGVMRGVPHAFGLSRSLTPAGFDGSTQPPDQRTGWSGDGAPGAGTLRDFATGAVTQHFPRTLNRINGTDFVLPNDDELDAMEAFQLTLGRQTEIDIAAMTFKNEVVQLGRRIFNNGQGQVDPTIAQGKCFQCHRNAGATNNGLTNPNFDTGVENLPAQPADLIDPENNPPDAGFGGALHASGGFGDGKFNTPSLLEAADTGPFFHNNAIETIEEAVNFYNSEAFNTSPSGSGGPVGNIKLAATEVVAVAAFLRVVNTDENLRQSTVEIQAAIGANWSTAKKHIAQSMEELKDAAEVLRGGRLHPAAQAYVLAALATEQVAIFTSSNSLRNSLLEQSNAKKILARADMIE